MSENLKTYFADILRLLKDTFMGTITSTYAIQQFNKLIEETKNIEDFDHENRIYVLEGEIKQLQNRVYILEANQK